MSDTEDEATVREYDEWLSRRMQERITPGPDDSVRAFFEERQRNRDAEAAARALECLMGAVAPFDAGEPDPAKLAEHYRAAIDSTIAILLGREFVIEEVRTMGHHPHRGES
jgi:hypothetical protein